MKDKIKIDRSSKIILLILCVYLIIMLIVFLPGYLKSRREKLFIITNTYQIKYEFGKWDKMMLNEKDRYKDYKVYEDNKYKGDYNIYFKLKMYLYNVSDDNKYNFTDYNGKLFAYKGTIPLKVIEYEKTKKSESDTAIINDALSKIGVNNITEFDIFDKIELDIDNDGEIETLYNISNFYDETDTQKVSLLFVYDKDINVIEKTVTDSAGVFSDPSYSLVDIINIKDDNSVELLYSENYYSEPDLSCLKLYNLNSKKEIKNFCK